MPRVDSLVPPEGRGTTPAQEALVVGIASFVVHLATRTRDFGGDDTVHALTVERVLNGSSWPFESLHPQHFLHNPLVAAVGALSRTVGPRPLVLDVDAGASAFAGRRVRDRGMAGGAGPTSPDASRERLAGRSFRLAPDVLAPSSRDAAIVREPYALAEVVVAMPRGRDP